MLCLPAAPAFPLPSTVWLCPRGRSPLTVNSWTSLPPPGLPSHPVRFPLFRTCQALAWSLRMRTPQAHPCSCALGMFCSSQFRGTMWNMWALRHHGRGTETGEPCKAFHHLGPGATLVSSAHISLICDHGPLLPTRGPGEVGGYLVSTTVSAAPTVP